MTNLIYGPDGDTITQEIYDALRAAHSNLAERCGQLRQEIERLNRKCGALAFLLYGPSTYRPLNPLEEEIERLRAALSEVADTLEKNGRFPNAVPAIRAELRGNTHEPGVGRTVKPHRSGGQPVAPAFRDERLHRIDRLMDAQPGTPEGAELDKLVDEQVNAEKSPAQPSYWETFRDNFAKRLAEHKLPTGLPEQPVAAHRITFAWPASDAPYNFELIREDYQKLTGVCPLPGPPKKSGDSHE